MIELEFIGFPYRAGVTADEPSGLVAPIVDLDVDMALFVTEVELADMIRPAFELTSEAVPAALVTVPGGDENKRVGVLEEAAIEALRLGATRSSVVVAAGGGFVGNLAGLMANLLYRGVKLLHVPTTLLGMSDGVLSVKQAVNTPIGKNQLGTYYTPSAVWSNVDYLGSLAQREVASALCESSKNALAIMPDQLTRTRDFVARVDVLTPDDFLVIIEDSIAAKASVMVDDVRERHAGLICEYGHTIGHAFELAMHGYVSHGSAVAFGMTVAAEVAVRMGVADASMVDAHHDLLEPLLPDTSGVSTQQLLDIVRYDNKRGYVRGGDSDHVDMILLDDLGKPHGDPQRPLTPVHRGLLAEVLSDRLA